MQYMYAKMIWTFPAQPLSQGAGVEQPVGPLQWQCTYAWEPRWRLTEQLRTIGVQGAYSHLEFSERIIMARLLSAWGIIPLG